MMDRFPVEFVDVECSENHLVDLILSGLNVFLALKRGMEKKLDEVMRELWFDVAILKSRLFDVGCSG